MRRTLFTVWLAGLCDCGNAWLLLLKCCFTSTETVGLLGTGAQDGHLDFHTAPELSNAWDPLSYTIHCLISERVVRITKCLSLWKLEGRNTNTDVTSLSIHCLVSVQIKCVSCIYKYVHYMDEWGEGKGGGGGGWRWQTMIKFVPRV